MMNILYALLVMIFLFTGFCRADIYVITHRDNPVQSINETQLKDLYLARSQTFPNGESAIIYEAGDDELRARFIRLALGMRVRQFDAYWARLVFAGRVLPLNNVQQEAQLLDHISNNIYAIGYIDTLASAGLLKTLLVIQE